MTTYFVSRHSGAKEWAENEGFKIDVMLTHLDDIDSLNEGDCVLGSLPVNLVADLNKRGVRYFHLTLSLTEKQRGREISAQLMRELGARLEEYQVRKMP